MASDEFINFILDNHPDPDTLFEAGPDEWEWLYKALRNLRITFGKDQHLLIDRIITEMEADDKILSIDRKVDGDNIHYILEFDSIYSVYLFGHKQANAGYKLFLRGGS